MSLDSGYRYAEEQPTLTRSRGDTILYPFDLLAVVSLVLLAVNALTWREAWPMLLAFTVAVTFALQQCVLLVRMGFRQP